MPSDKRTAALLIVWVLAGADNAVKYTSSERHGPSARLRGEAA